MIYKLLTHKSFWFFIIAISLINYYLYTFVYGGIFYLSDAYYYLSIANSWLNGDGIVDGTYSPGKPIITTQIGVVLIEMILKKIMLTDMQVLYTVSFMNLVLYILFLYIIDLVLTQIKILQLHRAIIILSLAFPFVMYKNTLQPLNDTLYLVLTALIIHLIILCHKNHSKAAMLSLVILALVVSNFRMQGFLPFIAAACTYLYFKEYKKSIFYLLLGVLSYLSVEALLFVFEVDKSGIYRMQNRVLDMYSIDFFVNGMVQTFTKALPSLLIMTKSIFLGVALAACMALFLYKVAHKTVENNFITVFLIVFVVMYILFFQLFFVYIPRYFIMIKPFLLVMFLVLLTGRKRRQDMLLLYLFVLFNINVTHISSLKNHYTAKSEGYAISNKQMPQKYDLISEDCRKTYFIYGRGCVELESIQAKEVVVIGSKKFAAQRIKMLQDTYGEIDIKQEANYFNAVGSRQFTYIVKLPGEKL